ncbi:MAG: hypothetical protein VX589_05245 [Myxococcota bacterium]|nr:hypothetical protein [Myxococcota bacterium]
MLLEIHANPGGLSAAEFSECVEGSGVNGVVVAQTQTVEGLTDYLAALKTRQITAFAGVELRLKKGHVIFVPETGVEGLEGVDWTNGGEDWDNNALANLVAERPGLLIGSHPYFRQDESPMGDRIYRVKGLTALVANRGQGPLSWDRLAQEAAQKHQIPAVASGGGTSANLGRAAIALDDSVKTVSALADALASNAFMIIEFDETNDRRTRETAPASPRRDDGRGGRGPRSNDRDRRPRRDDRRSGKGGRGPRRPRRD